MHIVGKFIQQSALVVKKQPWVEIVFPACCVSCKDDLQVSNLLAQEQRIAPTLNGNLLDRTSFSGTESGGEAPLASPDPASSLGFQTWQEFTWCRSCWKQIQQVFAAKCPRCAAGMNCPSPFGDRCANCLKTEFKFARTIAIGNYTGLLRELVVRMKNQHDEVLAIQLGRLLGYQLLGHGWTDFDCLVPVPLHWTRRLKRGFQATELLSDQISALTRIPNNPTLLRAVRAMKKQGTLSGKARIENVRDAYAVNPKFDLRGKRVLLVDDVMTSGATSSELARILKARGASEVDVAVVTRGGMR